MNLDTAGSVSRRKDFHDCARCLLAGHSASLPAADCERIGRRFASSSPTAGIQRACRSLHVRRWAQRRLLSVWCGIKIGGKDQHFLQTPPSRLDFSALCGFCDRGKKSVNASFDDLKQQIR